jgi:large subunit ribosomal protein L32
MGVPKRRVSKARQGERRAHHALKPPTLQECPHCHQPKRSHHACPNCGWYGGREVLRIKSRTKQDGTPS